MGPSLQERLNNEAPEAVPGNPNRSQYRLKMPLKNLSLLQEQTQSFNERMKENKIHVTFSQDEDYNVRFTFFMQLPHSQQSIELHRVLMPSDEEEILSEHATRTQLKRRFENQIEDLIERIYNSIFSKAKSNYENSYKKDFYFTIAPSVIHKLSDTVASDIAGSILESLPFSFQNWFTQPVIDFEEVKKLAKKAKTAKKQLEHAQQLSLEMDQFDQQLHAMPEEKNKEKEQLKKSVNEQFCNHFEKQITV